MKQQRYISILDTFSWNKLQIDVADIFHILKLKKTTMIASYEEGVIGVEQAKHLLDELEKLQYLWCLVEQNVSLTLDQFKHNLMHSTATNWVLIRQEIASLSCDQNLRFFPYLKIGNELYLVWLILKTLMQSPSSNDYQPYLYLPLNTNVTLALSTEVSSSKHLQHHIYLEVLLRLKQYLSTTSYLPNYDTPALPPQVTTEKLFDTLLERYQSLYCLSLNIQLPFKSSKMVDYHAFIQDRLMRIPQLQQMMIDTAGLLFMMTKTEHDLVSGLNLNVVLILSNKKQQLAERIIHKFESEFKRLLIDRPFYIHHWGKQLAQDLKKEEIDGGIKLTDKRKIKDYKYWILSFFQHVDDVIQFQYIFDNQNYNINQYWYSSGLLDEHNFPVDLTMMGRKSFQDLVCYEDDKIWSVRHLPVIAKNRLKISQIFNRELAIQLVDFPNFMGLIQNIEIFMATVMDTTVGAFNLPIRLGNVELSAEEIEHSITRIGHQLLWIYSHLYDLQLLSMSPFLSKLNINVQFFLKNMYLWQMQQQLGDKTSKQGAERFNALVKQLRLDYHSNIRQSKLDVKIWKQVQHSVTVDLDESTTDSNKTVVKYIDYVQAVDVGDEDIATNDHIEACYKKCELRLKSLQTYVKSLLKRECNLYRVHFGLGSNGAEVNQQIFSKNITEMFLRNRRRKPISSMTGYFGAWREYGGQHTYLDLILVFDARKYEELIDMDNLFWELWKSQMDSVQQDGYKTSFNIVPLMPSVPELNQQSFLLELGDQSRRKQVFDALVNYYSFIELYERQATVRVPKVLVKGSVTKTKVKSKVKTKAKV
ncbi:hypothetical protein WAI17_08275 [Acinetobacter baumannii]|uniref:hypothetical protein n=1 Tax=Acinetobacter TaxID=469 RepID=UPI000A55593C|nr:MULTISPECIES: hypothetical protein [Acinetobacter]MBJ9718977.1 hypothetical protein [Acinetobacter pittii]MBJ9777857.1 hypothetical protein [Acinetobacter pittii]MCH7319955.1 hypothetical protein [Acinetobacter higginsii]MDA3512779.1 hypothetical protein [Acinetobacter baumannii]MDA3515126.1 hypothetical protein [Acinetobacter baumannii]